MAMTFSFRIHPFGYSAEPIEFGTMDVHSAGPRHEYLIRYKAKGEWHNVRGYIAKRMPDGTKRSGHRNFLHLLQDILADANLDALGEDYVHVLDDIKDATGFQGRVGDYPDDE